MLRRLEIRNYGLIRSADIAFADGATMFTGETGSGKTMILGALAFALGARSSADVVGRFGERALVTLIFEPGAALAERLTADGFEIDAGELAAIEREMTAAGKSQLRLNGRTATASVVRAFADRIAEIVGQHEAQRLLAPAVHGEILDRFAGAPVLERRGAVETAYANVVMLQRERDALVSDARTARQRYDAARSALDEISAVSPENGEDERLDQRRRFLDNAERIALALQQAHGALADDEYSSASGLGIARNALESIAEFSPVLFELGRAAAALQEETTDLAARISREAAESDYDARELESINERLAALETLKRRYGPTLTAVLEHAAASRALVDAFEHRDEALGSLEARVASAAAELTSAAALLTAARAHAAENLRDAVHAELQDLALAAARFEARLTPLEAAGGAGAETIEFYFSANPGEAMRPLAKVASGGELSRVLLALIVATQRDSSSTALIFDEIDAGIGGATGTAVGARLGRLARHVQVVCVTHLAQLATWADQHYVLEKHGDAERTVIDVRAIARRDDRAAELARMLSGVSNDVALAHALTLLERVGD